MNLNGSAMARHAPLYIPGRKLNRATQKLNAFPHGPEAKGIARRSQRARNIEALSVILNFHRHRVPSTRQSDPDAVGAGMGHDIGKRPLKHLIQSCFVTRGQVRGQSASVKPNLDSSSSRELARIEVNRWYETLLVPDRRPQIKSKVPNALESVFYQVDRLFQFPAKLADIALFQIECDYFRVELQHNQVMADFVMQVLC